MTDQQDATVSQLPTDPAFYERLLAALDRHRFTTVLLWVLALAGLFAYVYLKKG